MKDLDILNVKVKEWEEKCHPLLQSEIDKLLQTIHDGQSIMESRNYEIAAGGLALSLTVLSLFYSLGKLPSGSEWAVVSIRAFSPYVFLSIIYPNICQSEFFQNFVIMLQI